MPRRAHSARSAQNKSLADHLLAIRTVGQLLHGSNLFGVPQRVKRDVDEPLIRVQGTKHRKRMDARVRLERVLGLGDKLFDSRAFTEFLRRELERWTPIVKTSAAEAK